MVFMNSTQQARNVRSKFDKDSKIWSELYQVRSRANCKTYNQYDVYVRRENALELLGDKPGSVLLDVGSGTGDFFSMYQRCYEIEAAYFTNVDFSFDMLRRQSRVSYLVNPGRIQADLTAVPLHDGIADSVVCLGVLEYISEWERAIEEVVRVLAPGGLVVMSIPNKSSLFRYIDNRRWRPLRWLFSRIGVLSRFKKILRKDLASPSNGECSDLYDHTEFEVSRFLLLLENYGLQVAEIRYSRFFFSILNCPRISMIGDDFLSLIARKWSLLYRQGMTVVLSARKII